jgi:glycogen debranching enzyme
MSAPIYCGKPLRKSELREIPPPPEPRIAYAEPHLLNTEYIALIRGKTFFAANLHGHLMPPGAPHVGLFRDDTRYLSELDLLINGHSPVVLSSTIAEGSFANRVELTVKGSLKGEGLDLPVNTVYVRREQVLELEVLHDVLHLENFHTESAKLKVEMIYDADFMDIFQVRGILRGRSGRYYAPFATENELVFLYDGLDHRVRSTTISFDPAPSEIAERTARWEIELAPLGRAQITTTVTPRSEDEASAFTMTSSSPEDISECATAAELNRDLEVPLRSLQSEFAMWQEECTLFRSNNDAFDAMLRTAVQDFYALRLTDGGDTAIAAGVPWFAALFGRDSLIASFETLILNPKLAQGTLRVLAFHQGRNRNDARDEDPGKIHHEMRSGEMAATGEIVFGLYYGSVDATPLFVILLSEYYQWTGDNAFLEEMRAPLLAAVDWLLYFGDLDGDGLIEFCRRTPEGLFNQGWKDSGDANLHADGRIAQPPIALVEEQGYAIDAFTRASALLRILGLNDQSDKLAQRAVDLRARLDRAFWMPDKKYYALALDSAKQPLEVVASNAGHLLFSNAIEREKAAGVVGNLLAQGLFSGWGIRTLSQGEKTFNPMSYHRGSVWPHDNALIAYGMARYGFRAESSLVLSALFDAAKYFRDYRLPELFCGIQRRERDVPVQYPVSCSPQAWASGAPFLILTALLGLKPDACKHELNIQNPYLPDFLTYLEIKNLRIGESRVSLEFSRQGARTFCNLTDLQGAELAVSVVYR